MRKLASIAIGKVISNALNAKTARRLGVSDPTWTPRGLSRQEAAAYIGISPNVFDQLVKDLVMPQPRFIRSKKVWDRFELDIAFGLLPNVESFEQSSHEWDVV